MSLNSVLSSYSDALRRWMPFLASHLYVRLVVASLMVPVIGLLLAATLLLSDQTALTDQDIARFMLSPAGAIGAIVVLSLLLVAVVLDLVVATAILQQHRSGPLEALLLAARFSLHAVPRLLPFVARLLIKILIIVVPFLAVAGGIAYALINEHDINYYLTESPPEFLMAMGAMGLVLLGLAALLLSKLSGWAISMHLVIFDDVAPSEAFGLSRQHMEGHRKDLVGQLIGWGAIRVVLTMIASASAALGVTLIAGWEPDSLRRLATAMIISALIYVAVSAFINAVSNGALANILNDEFDRALIGRAPAYDVAEISGGRGYERLIIAAVAVASVIGLGAGGFFVEQLKKEVDAEIIAHRGAAALAPENTMAAVQRALDDGADWIEIDVQESAEGEVIVVHDSDFMKSSNVPTKVWDVTAEDLAYIDVGSWFDPAYSDERVPSLLDVLEAAKGQAGVIIELKYYGHDEDLERRVAAIVEDAGMTDQISTMSLKYPAVQKMLEIRPDWRTGVLAATSVGDLSGLDGDFLALSQARINTRVVQRAEAAGKDVYAWTVNDPVAIVRMLWLGVDGLITDDPGLARNVLDGYNRLSVGERMVIALSDRISITVAPEDIDNLRP